MKTTTIIAILAIVIIFSWGIFQILKDNGSYVDTQCRRVCSQEKAGYVRAEETPENYNCICTGGKNMTAFSK